MRCCGKCQPFLLKVTFSWIAAALYTRFCCTPLMTLIGLPLSSTAGSANGAPDCGPSGRPFNRKPVGATFCVMFGDVTGVDGQPPGEPSGKNDARQRTPKNFIATFSTFVPLSGSCVAFIVARSLLQSN